MRMKWRFSARRASLPDLPSARRHALQIRAARGLTAALRERRQPALRSTGYPNCLKAPLLWRYLGRTWRMIGGELPRSRSRIPFTVAPSVLRRRPIPRTFQRQRSV